MTTEKYEWLKSVAKNIGSVTLSVEEFNEISKAIEKSIAKKPIHEHKNYYCPVCKENGWILWDDADPNDFDNFCGKCGQKLNWEI